MWLIFSRKKNGIKTHSTMHRLGRMFESVCCHPFHGDSYIFDGWKLECFQTRKKMLCSTMLPLDMPQFSGQPHPLFCCYSFLSLSVSLSLLKYFRFQDGFFFLSLHNSSLCTANNKGSWYLLLRPPICRMDILLMIGAQTQNRKIEETQMFK